jgi:hypothetical protein
MSAPRKTAAWTWLFLSIILAIGASPGIAAVRITDLECIPVPGGANVTIKADGPISQSAFTMDDPEPRLVLDLTGAVHELGRYRYEHLATGVITRIRTSQYRPYPRPVVRIVFDLPQLVPYQIDTRDDRLVIFLQEGAQENRQSVPEPPAANPMGASEKMAQNGDDAEVGQHRERSPEAIQHPDRKPGVETPSGEGEMIQQAAAPEAGLEKPEVHPDSAGSTQEAAEIPADTSGRSNQQENPLSSRFLALSIREPVSYHNGGRRDPFVALPTGQEVEFGQTPLPDVGKLSIVGILSGPDGYRALVQDDRNNGYVLRKGDRVLYGYVLRIEAERIIFRLNRRGLDRTVILNLPE